MFVSKRKYEDLLKISNRLAQNEATLHAELLLMNQVNSELLREKNQIIHNLKNSKSSDMDQKLINRLIRFCHPDKHNGSKLANELTSELLKLRK